MKRVLLLTRGALVQDDDFGGPNKGDIAYKPPIILKEKVKRVLLLTSGALVQDDDFGEPNKGDVAYKLPIILKEKSEKSVASDQWCSRPR